MPNLAVLLSAVLVLWCGQTDRHTDRITDVDQRYTHATTGVRYPHFLNWIEEYGRKGGEFAVSRQQRRSAEIKLL